MFGEKISQQDYYNYLGLLFNYNGNFYKARSPKSTLFIIFKQINNTVKPALCDFPREQ